MAHIPIETLVPNPADLLDLEVEEIAGVLLVHLNSDPAANTGLYPFKSSDGRVNHSSFFTHIHHKTPYASRMDEVSIALKEAWGWLQSAGLLVNDRDHWCFLSRRARRLTSLDDVRNYQNARLLPKAQIHSLIAARVYPAFLRGAYDTAIFEAFREVEIAVRTAGGFPSGAAGVPLMQEAFRVANPKNNQSAGPLTDTKVPVPEQEAMRNLFAGAMGFYRNSVGHRHVPTHPASTAEVILFASQLLRIVDELKP